MNDGQGENNIMEYNKDESIKCFDIASECLAKGDKDRALKFALKSERLYSSTKAKELLEKINRLSGTSDNEASNGHAANNNGPRRRNRNPNDVSSQSTEEEVNAVNRIKQCKDYYEILGVAKDATESEIKKRYRKLALQFHPDKNHAPGAVDAFKAIGNAFSVLSNKDKRRQYDMAGPSRFSSTNDKHSQQQWDFTHGFESEMTPEEIFNMFFSGSDFSSSRSYSNGGTAHTFRRHRHVNNENWSQLLLQISPIFVLIILSIASFAFVDDQQYSFVQSTKFPKRRVSENLQVEYFVPADFTEKHNRHSARRVDRDAERTFATNLQDKCRKETIKKEKMLMEARQLNDAKTHTQTEKSETKHCQQLRRLQGIT